jgi:hypothetical protein
MTERDTRARRPRCSRRKPRIRAGAAMTTIELNDMGSVAYDMVAYGAIVRIKGLEVQIPERIAIAPKFAAELDLGFPGDLAWHLI